MRIKIKPYIVVIAGLLGAVPVYAAGDNNLYTTLLPRPEGVSINEGLTAVSPVYMKQVLGEPGRLSSDCSDITNPYLRKMIVTQNVGPFMITGYKPFVGAVAQVLARVKAEKPELYKKLGTAGCLCVRKVRGGTNYSNHAWGTAIDITIAGKLDERGDNRTQSGLSELYPYFHEAGFYWGAGFPTEDSMHFEASAELIERWHAADNKNPNTGIML